MRRNTLHHLPSIFLLLVFTSLRVFSQSESKSHPSLVHFGDLIEIDVIGSFEYDWRGSLTPEGYLDGLDYLDQQIYALCRSEEELSVSVEKEYAKTLRDPKVTVRILDRSNRAVAFLTGAVRSPQRFQIKRPVYLNELLILSGGITDRSSGEVAIFRPANLGCSDSKKSTATEFLNASRTGGSETFSIKIPDILRGDPSANPRIMSGDIVTVSEAHPVYLIGGVNAPQQISLRNQITLSRALAMAGGLSKDFDGVITIFRRDNRETKRLQADIKKIAAGQAEDPVLKPFDIVDVPLKGRAARTRPPSIDQGRLSGSGLSSLPLRIID